jgi:transposase
MFYWSVLISTCKNLETHGQTMFTVSDFLSRFPDDDTSLTHLMRIRFGLRHVCRACGHLSTFHKLSGYRAFACARCANHIFPCAGTIFHGTKIPLHLWFFLAYRVMNGQLNLDAPQVQRMLGVNYRTARRMLGQIRQILEVQTGRELLRCLLSPVIERRFADLPVIQQTTCQSP